MKRLTKFAAASGLALALGGCVGPVEIAPLPYAHPANPAAPPGTLPPLGTGLQPASGAAGGGGKHGTMTHEGSEAGTAGESVGEGKFQCPMHPEVRSAKPGRCPKCGMKLVESKSNGSGGHEGEHER